MLTRTIAAVIMCASCGRVAEDVPIVDASHEGASDAPYAADACPQGSFLPMAPARHENVCTQADIDAYVACSPCTAEDGGACAKCLYTAPNDTTWGPEVPFAVGDSDLITLPNVWECIDLLTETTCGDALYSRDMCVFGMCDHGAYPPPCDVEYEASTCNTDALAGVCKPYDDIVRASNGPCAGVLDVDGGPVPAVARCFAGRGPIAAVFCGPG